MSSIIAVLIVEDDGDWKARLAELVGKEVTVDEASSLEEALSCIRKRFYYCAVVDKSLIPGEGEDEGGMRVLETLIKLGEGTKGLMLTAFGSIPSARKALKDWKVTDYIEKHELKSVEGRKAARDQIHKMIHEARTDYAKRYGSGIDQLTADSQNRAIWTANVISMVAAAGKKYEILSRFLDRLLEEIPPLIPYEPGESAKIERASAIVEGRYWSKGLGESVCIRFGKKAAIEAEKQSLAPETIIRRANYDPYGGLILRTGLRFEDLPR